MTPELREKIEALLKRLRTSFGIKNDKITIKDIRFFEKKVR